MTVEEFEKEQAIRKIRITNIEETVLKTKITAILENNELSNKEKVDNLIETIEIKAESEKIDELEDYINELEIQVNDLEEKVVELINYN